MELIKAELKHTDELVEMNNQLVIDEQFDVFLTQSEMIERMIDFISGNIYDCYLIIENKTIYGYCLLDKTKKPIYLRHLFIKSSYRGMGFGKNTILSLMNKYSSESLDIEVMSWNKNAIAFYEKLGFTNRYNGMRIAKT